MFDDFRRCDSMACSRDGDVWRIDEFGDRDYAGRIDDPLTSFEVEPEDVPVLAIWAADYLDASADLRGEARHHYFSGRGL